MSWSLITVLGSLEYSVIPSREHNKKDKVNGIHLQAFLSFLAFSTPHACFLLLAKKQDSLTSIILFLIAECLAPVPITTGLDMNNREVLTYMGQC